MSARASGEPPATAMTPPMGSRGPGTWVNCSARTGSRGARHLGSASIAYHPPTKSQSLSQDARPFCASPCHAAPLRDSLPRAASPMQQSSYLDNSEELERRLTGSKAMNCCTSACLLRVILSVVKKSLRRRRHSREGAPRNRSAQPSETVALRRSNVRQLSNTACACTKAPSGPGTMHLLSGMPDSQSSS